MPRQRSFRTDICCPNCGSNWIINYGKDREKQTVLCRNCERRHTPSAKRRFHSDQIRRLAARMYWNGVSGAAIARILEVNVRTVYSWIKNLVEWGKKALDAKRASTYSNRTAAAISIDEMWTYQDSNKPPNRKDQWIWTAVIEWSDGSLSRDFVVGDRSESTLLKLLKRLPAAETYYTDHYGVYKWFQRSAHVVGKGEKVNRNEGLHSLLRDSLYRLRRRTKGPTRCVKMLKKSVALVLVKNMP